ncbi:MAG: hypothetical protein R3344_03375 [Acidobacteriota bacterium]|nr:hypothetical protein [Acidobacteriota bacterium]
MASYDKAIPPGQVGKFRIKLDTGDLRGKVNRGVTLTTNDRTNRLVYLQVTADVLASVELLPPAVMLGGRRNIEVGKVVVRKEPSEVGELKPSDIRTSKPWLVATARQVTEREEIGGKVATAEPGDWVIETRVEGSAPWGPSQESLTFKTALGREPEVTIPVKVLIPSPIQVNPSPLRLLRSEDGRSAEGILLAVLKQGLEKETLEIEVGPAPFVVEVEQTGSRHYKAFVRWSGADSGAPINGTAKLTISEGTREVPLEVVDQIAPGK